MGPSTKLPGSMLFAHDLFAHDLFAHDLFVFLVREQTFEVNHVGWA